MRNFISSIILLFLAVNLNAQNADHFCGHQHVMNKIDQLNSVYSEHFRALTDEFNSNRNSSDFGPCTVNVVVHVVYFNEAANVSDDQVFNQIDILNRRLNHLNSDTSLLRDQFLPIVGNPSGIFFKLAEIDPQGNSTNGIIRVQTNRDGFGSSNEFLSEDVKYTSEGGSSTWDTQRYLNIWVCDTKDEAGMPILAGYATPPANLPNWPGGFEGIVDGVVIQWEYFGNDNDNLGKVAVHEVGHYFGLRHIWGDEFDCEGDDGINDTPSAADYSFFLCSQNANTCQDNINGEDLFDMVENYMDYSFPGCQVAFTNDQNAFMNWVFENYRSQLCWDVTSINNLKAQKLQLFPQPASTFINTGLIGNKPFKIIDISGNIVQNGQLINGIITWNNLPNGLYLLNVGEINQRFIVINP